MIFVFVVGRRWMGLWIILTNQTLMPLRCLWDRFQGPGLRSSYVSFLSLMEQSMKSMFSETAARVHHRAKVSCSNIQKHLSFYSFDFLIYWQKCISQPPVIETCVHTEDKTQYVTVHLAIYFKISRVTLFAFLNSINI